MKRANDSDDQPVRAKAKIGGEDASMSGKSVNSKGLALLHPLHKFRMAQFLSSLFSPLFILVAACTHHHHHDACMQKLAVDKKIQNQRPSLPTDLAKTLSFV